MMINYVRCYSFFLLSLIICVPEVHSMSDSDRDTGVIDCDGNPRKPIIDLLNNLGVELPDKDLDAVVEITQEIWKRPDNKNRWEIEEKYPEKRRAILKCMGQVGCLQEFHAWESKYDAIVFLGATYARMEDRLEIGRAHV